MQRITPTVVVASNTFFQLLGRVISALATLATTVVLARSLDVAGYGDFSKITTFVGFFYLVTDLGINASFLRLDEQQKKQVSWQHLFGLRLLISVVAIFLAVSILSFIPRGVGQGYTSIVRFGIIFYTLTVISQGVITTTNALFQLKLRYDLSSIAVIAGSLVTLGITLVAVHGSIIAAILSLLAGSILTMILSLLFSQFFTPSLSPRFSTQSFRVLLSDALPLSLTLVFNIIYFRVDSIVLTLTQPTTDVGIYNLAYKFFEFPLVLPIFFMNALYPFFLKAAENNKRQLNGWIKKAGGLLFLGGIGTTITVFLGAPVLTHINPSFNPSIPTLRLLALSYPFFFLTSLTMWTLISLKKNTALVIIYGLSMIGNIIADILLIPVYGYWAAALITVIGEGIILLLSGIIVLLLMHTQDNIFLKRV